MKTIGHTLPPHPGRGSAQRRFRHHGAWCRLAGWLLLGISGMGTAAASPDGVGQYITDAAEIRRQVEREVERLVDEQLTPADQYLNQLTQAVSTRFPLHEVGTRVQVRVSYNPSRMFVADGILRRVDTDGAGIGCIYYLAADIAWEDWCRLNPDCNWRARERAMNRDSQQYLRQREELAARIRSQRLPQAMAEKGYSFDRRTRTWQPPATAAPDDAGIQPVAGTGAAGRTEPAFRPRRDVSDTARLQSEEEHVLEVYRAKVMEPAAAIRHLEHYLEQYPDSPCRADAERILRKFTQAVRNTVSLCSRQ